MANWQVDVRPSAVRDLIDIQTFLEDSHLAFGQSRVASFHLAERRVEAILARVQDLASTPAIGMLKPDLGEQMRQVTLDRTVFYFRSDRETRIVSILAIFLPGQDHQTRMLRRMSAVQTKKPGA